MQERLQTMMAICRQDPAVANIGGSAGGNFSNGTNTARMFMSLKPLEERKVPIDVVMARLRQKLSAVPGASLYMQASQDLRIGGRGNYSLYQFTMRGDNLKDLAVYGPKMLKQLRAIPLITDVNTDQQNNGLQSVVHYDRRTASRFGISPQLIDNTLYDAFGQRQVSTMYTALNQYHVVMEAAPKFWQDPLMLDKIYVRSPGGSQVPLSAFARYAPANTPLAVNHQGLFPAVTISFNLAPGVALGDAVDAIEEARRQGRPASVDPHYVRRDRASLPGFTRQPAAADRRRAGHGLHRARHAV